MALLYCRVIMSRRPKIWTCAIGVLCLQCSGRCCEGALNQHEKRLQTNLTVRLFFWHSLALFTLVSIFFYQNANTNTHSTHTHTYQNSIWLFDFYRYLPTIIIFIIHHFGLWAGCYVIYCSLHISCVVCVCVCVFATFISVVFLVIYSTLNGENGIQKETAETTAKILFLEIIVTAKWPRRSVLFPRFSPPFRPCIFKSSINHNQCKVWM